jgi:hypothetical protein
MKKAVEETRQHGQHTGIAESMLMRLYDLGVVSR